MAQRPSEKPDWIPDDATGILAPNGAKRAAGWLIEKPPLQYFNWFWNIISQWMDFFGGQSQEWIVIDSDADERDYATLAAYIADTPAAGDKLLIKKDQTVTVQTIIPSDITIKFLDGARLLCATNIATSVLQLGSNIVIEGVLNIVLSQAGTTAKAVEYDGDNVTGQINVENASTGTLTTAHHINAAKTGNRVGGFVQNTGGGALTNIFVDASTEASNVLIIVDELTNTVLATNLVDLGSAQTLANKSLGAGTKIALGLDANGDMYVRNGGVLARIGKGAPGQLLQQGATIGAWTNKNISDANATDLTDGGATVLHSHAAGAPGAGSVAQASLKTTTGEVSTTATHQALTLPGGEYGFYPQIKVESGAGSIRFEASMSSAIAADGTLSNQGGSTAYITSINLGIDGIGTFNVYAQQRYIQASPPYKVGNKNWGHFLYLLVNSNGDIISAYEAEDPPYAYNGPEFNKKDSPERIQAVPHPFVDYWHKDPATDGLEIVMVDLRNTDTAAWKNDNAKVGRGLLEDLGSINKKGKIITPSSLGIQDIQGFTNKVKIRNGG